MKPKIEKVDHNLIHNYHTCCVIDYFESSDCSAQVNYSSEITAREYRIKKSVGMWKIKTLKNKYHAN